MNKKFKLLPEKTQELAPGHGACFATDKIVVDGHPVRFMYRERPDNELDSGWRFMAGLENDDYMNEPSNHGIYDVNTVANYDPRIIPFHDTPVGSTFERPGDGDFVQVHDFQPPED